MSLTMENITLTYPDGESRVTALDNVSLSIPNGSFTAVVGPSGSGKSSALAVAATLITPDSGKLVIADRNIQDMNEKQRAQLRREHIGIVFQQANLLSSLSALEQLQLQASLVGTSMKESETKALDFLDTVGLADHRNKKPSQLSGGQQQRVNIARALMNDPDLILADEPTSALDQQKSVEVMTLIREITKTRNTATMFITHDPSALIQPDQTITIVDGKIVSAHTAEVAPSL